jgi:hypothetical protein
MRIHAMIFFAAAITSAATAEGSLLYSATTSPLSGYNPGLGGNPQGTGLQPDLVFDDVLVANPQSMPQVSITHVSVGILRLSNAPAVTLSVFASSLEGEGLQTLPSLPPVLLGTTSLAANSAASFLQIVDLDLSLAPVVVNLDGNLIPSPSTPLGAFAIGLQFGGPMPANQRNGWRLATPDIGFANAAVFWKYDSDPGVFGLQAFAFASPAPSSFYMAVDGTLIPCPGCALPCGLATWVVLGSRRHRRKSRGQRNDGTRI